MIKVESKISIQSEIEKIWKFLTDISMGLSFNRFHKKINIENSFSLKPDSSVVIKHNFGFGAYDMLLEVIEMHPPNKIIFEEKAIEELDQLFFHRTTFSIIREKDAFCELNYFIEGTFNNKFADMSFKPILKGVMLDELIKIKLAIESSHSNTKSGHFNTA